MPINLDQALRDDLEVADAALADALKRGDRAAEQRACIFALTAVQRSFPLGQEYASLIRLANAFERVIEGVADPLFEPLRPSRARPFPERMLDCHAVMLVRLFTEAGLPRGAAFKRVADIMSAAGMTGHGGGATHDAGTIPGVTEGLNRAGFVGGSNS